MVVSLQSQISNTMKEIASIKKRSIGGGRYALDLHYYKDGKRVRESLKLYLYPPSSDENRRLNENTLAIANKIRSDKIIELVNKAGSVRTIKSMGMHDFIKKEFHGSMLNILHWVDDIDVSNVTKDFCLQYINSILESELADSTKHHYIHDLNAVLRRAVMLDNLYENPMQNIDIHRVTPQPIVAEKDFLEEWELMSLISYRCKTEAMEQIRKAYVFACYTGLRISDLTALKWGNIVIYQGHKAVKLKQTKTTREVIVPIVEEWLLPTPPSPYDNDTRVFNIPEKRCIGNAALKRIAKQCCIDKVLSWHTARKTFACRLLSHNVNPIVVAELLGHRGLETVMVYAKAIDSSKLDAIDSLTTKNDTKPKIVIK